jgi:hypothetical protein
MVVGERTLEGRGHPATLKCAVFRRLCHYPFDEPSAQSARFVTKPLEGACEIRKLVFAHWVAQETGGPEVEGMAEKRAR